MSLIDTLHNFFRMLRFPPLLLVWILAAPLGGCLYVKVDVNVKVDKALDDFFGDLDKKSSTLEKK